MLRLIQFTTFVALSAMMSPVLSAQTLTTLYNFNGTDGGYPVAALVQSREGDLYGTTGQGGANQEGTVFKITTNGALTTLHSFCAQSHCTDGAGPLGGVIQATDGNFYGTTFLFGANAGIYLRGGTVFKITAGGKLTTLYSFCAQSNCTDGNEPAAGLVQAADGDFYGTTYSGGAYDGGTVFKITPSGELTTIYSFCALSECADGKWPAAALIQAKSGELYGTTTYGGVYGGESTGGTVFKIDKGVLTTVYSFCAAIYCLDGANPYGLVQASNGDFYGTTAYGGDTNEGVVFRLTGSGEFTDLFNFCVGCEGSVVPEAPLIQASDGNLYGTTSGGTVHGGAVFMMTLKGKFSALDLCSGGQCPNGQVPFAALVEASNGELYGAASTGGTSKDGTIFTLSLGLDPLME